MADHAGRAAAAAATAERVYCSAAVSVRAGDVKVMTGLSPHVSPIVPTDGEFKLAFSTARVPKSKLARYYLIALESGHKGDPEPEFVPNSNEEEVNLEHVLPKNAEGSEWENAFNTDELKDWVLRIGNMALLQKGPNGRIGNRPFSVKKPVLAASSFALTSEIGTQTDWTPREIESRQAKLAEIAVTVWPKNL